MNVETATVAWPGRAELAESPVWDERSQRLYWVDILAGNVHRFDPLTGQDEYFSAGEPVGAIALCTNGQLVLATASGFAIADWGSVPRLIAAVEADLTTNLMNDGKCDAHGRFWAGTAASDETADQGALYRLEPNGSVTKVLAPVSLSNGLDWSIDGGTLYYVDSSTQRIDTFRFDPVSGSLSERRPWAEIPIEFGVPDGLTVDVDGGVWVAIWGAGRVRRYTQDGELDLEVLVPARLTTSCTFGGPKLEVLFVTCAAAGLAEERDPYVGAIFSCFTGHTGRSPRRYVR